MIFPKKKKDKDIEDELEDIETDDEDELDFKEFESFDEETQKNKDLDPEEIKKGFILIIPNGCPICGADVKGNEYYKYFCERCNVLFDKKDILDKEFGRSVADIGPVRKTRLNDTEKAALEQKRKELKERIFKTFTLKEKKELVHEAAARVQEEPVREEAEVPEAQEPAEEPVEEETVQEETVEASDEAVEPETETEEYELETPDKIIASKESTKMHAGTCHFVKKIHPKNRIYFSTTEQAEQQGYNLCVCLRRLKVRQR